MNNKVIRHGLPILGLTLLLLAGVSPAAEEEERFKDTKIETVQVTDGIYMLQGAGGNIGVSTGPDGVFLIDDQYAPLTERIKAAIKKLSDRPIRFVINTHWHGDHTGGNENLGKGGVVIVAHDNVYQRMTRENFMEPFNMTVPPAPAAALPVISFNDTVTFHLNGQQIHAMHVDNAHTDGDSVLHFTTANVIHAGDVWFNGSYPLIDVDSHGSLDGMILAVERILALANTKTKIIPGHGPLGDRAGLEKYLDVLRDVRERVQKLINRGQTVDQVIAARPLADYDATLGQGFLTPEVFLKIVYRSLKK